MKNLIIICGLLAAMLISSCKGNPNTTAGDSTGTGAGGARVPGKVVADTTRHDSTNTDSAKKR